MSFVGDISQRGAHKWKEPRPRSCEKEKAPTVLRPGEDDKNPACCFYLLVIHVILG
jgi:hypothetical protein